MQPRVTPSLPIGHYGSLFQRIFSSSRGIDPYVFAVSDVCQDLFGEGSFAGKGIYDIDAFETALAGKIPENAMLSHDLFEGVFARAALPTRTLKSSRNIRGTLRRRCSPATPLGSWRLAIAAMDARLAIDSTTWFKGRHTRSLAFGK